MPALYEGVHALVVEGGGMRAAYGSGVLARLQEDGFEPDAIYGTSAGAALAAWYAAKQAEYGVRTFDHAADPRVLSYKRWMLGRGPLLDIEDLFGRVYVDELRLDVDAVSRAPYPVIVTAVEVATGVTRYFDIRGRDVLQYLRASSALPLAVAGEIRIDGTRYLDGGVTDPVPIRRAIADGARDITLVLNRPARPRTPEPMMMTWLVGRRYPALFKSTARHHALWNDALATALAPPEGVRVRIIAPAADLGVSRLTRDLVKLANAVAAGRHDAHTALAAADAATAASVA